MSSVPRATAKPRQTAEQLVPVLKSKVKYYNTTAKNLQEERNQLETWFVKSIVASKNKEMLSAYITANQVFKHLEDGSILGVYSTDELEDSPITATAPAPRASASSGRPALPGYTAEEFDAKLPAWAKLVTGRDGKTASALLTKLSTKATFTEEQRARILALKPATEDATPAAAPAPAAGEHDDFVADMDAAEGAAQ
jgi:hypothetical protein